MQSRQSAPRDSWEVVVFIVESNVVGEEVQRTIVREGLRNGNTLLGVSCALADERSLVEDVVLGDEVSGAWVKRSCEETAQDEISDRFTAPCLDDDVVEE